jgi:hypothetical protein
LHACPSDATLVRCFFGSCHRSIISRLDFMVLLYPDGMDTLAVKYCESQNVQRFQERVDAISPSFVSPRCTLPRRAENVAPRRMGR